MLWHFNFQITQLTRAAPAAHGGATGQQLPNWGCSQGPSCHFVFRQLNNLSCKGTTLSGFPSCRSGCHHTADHSRSPSQGHDIAVFELLSRDFFSCPFALAGPLAFIPSIPGSPAAEQEFPVWLEQPFPEVNSPSLPLLTGCSMSNLAPACL